MKRQEKAAVSSAPSLLLRMLRAPWLPSTWLATAYLCLNVPLGLAGASAVLVLLALAATLAITVVFGVACCSCSGW
jgi:hypothetical protein